MNKGETAVAADPVEQRWMQMALRLARKGRGFTSPNPMVGAVVVSRSGELAGAAWHRGPGKPHAEVLALAQAGDLAKGAAVFVNLEPCAHHGRTPPCVKALLQSGVASVVCSIEDPDPRVSGKGVAALREAGVDVRAGLCETEARDLNRAYIKHRSQNRPYVSLKMALSADGRTSAADGSSRWITGEAARRDVHRLRARSDAVCAGIGTVLRDDPSLTARGLRKGRQVCRVIVDSLARTPPEARVLKDGAPTLVYVSARAPEDRLKALEAAGAEIAIMPSESAMVPIDPILEHLATRSIMNLLLEGGPRLAGSFEADKAIDRYFFYVAPKLLGSPATGPVIDGWVAASIGDARRLRIESVKRFGDDLRIEAFPVEGSGTGPPG